MEVVVRPAGMAVVAPAAVKAGTAVRVQGQVINPAGHPVVAEAAVALVRAGAAIPVAVVDINPAQARVVRAAAICGRTAILVTVVMVGQAAAIAEA
jgi:hypothetical protein